MVGFAQVCKDQHVAVDIRSADWFTGVYRCGYCIQCVWGWAGQGFGRVVGTCLGTCCASLLLFILYIIIK